MSDGEGEKPEDVGEEFKFFAERAKSGRAGCKKCKQKIDKGVLRMAKLAANPFGSGMMKVWHHVPCMFEVFSKQRAKTAKIECLDDIGGWDTLESEDQEEILQHLPESARVRKAATCPAESSQQESKQGAASSSKTNVSPTPSSKVDLNHRDNSLREFRRLCADVANVSSYTDKTALVNRFITKGTDSSGFKGDLLLTVRLLLPGVIKRIYNLQSKQIIKLFSRLFRTDQDAMLVSLEDGDVAETIRIFFESNKVIPPAKKSLLTLQEVDTFLEKLSELTKEDDQLDHFSSIIPKCTGNDLKMIIRFIKHDLRINAGAKHILEAVHKDAYPAFQASRDINSIISKVSNVGGGSIGSKTQLAARIILLTPVLPMLAQPCKSAAEALQKCPNGMYADIKYDGERVQVHKKNKEFKYFSRSLKPVLRHKVQSLEMFIPKAFPYGQDLILDCEILLMDTKTSKPLPFGTLGKHKKAEFQDATVCLFVFDCIYYNGESLSDRPLKERRDILLENMCEIPHRVVVSEMEEIYNKRELENLIIRVFKEGLEGLVLKDTQSIYEPGKRHWLKIKKDYLCGGAMADSADLVVLGAWYGTGQKGGMMSVFLMGCYDEDNNCWCTVTKVHTGHDDASLERLQKELQMVKISKDMNRVPSWLRCTKTMVPDFVAKDPKKQPVWEITGAELTKHVVHTADGISVRFPRVTRIRDDKNWETATNLSQLKVLYEKSKETSDFTLPGYSESEDIPVIKKPKTQQISKNLSPKKRGKDTSVDEGFYEIKKPLPNIFHGIKMRFPENSKRLSNYAKNVLPRYFIAYGGEIIEDEDEKGTHFFMSDEVGKESDELTSSGTCVPVTVSWMFESISSQVLQPIPNFKSF